MGRPAASVFFSLCQHFLKAPRRLSKGLGATFYLVDGSPDGALGKYACRIRGRHRFDPNGDFRNSTRRRAGSP